MLQQAQGERDIVPLALRLAPLEACGQLLGQLFGVLVLFFPVWLVLRLLSKSVICAMIKRVRGNK